jgi:hypothetical protein
MSIFHDFLMTFFYHFAKNILSKLAYVFGKQKKKEESPQLPITSKGV